MNWALWVVLGSKELVPWTPRFAVAPTVESRGAGVPDVPATIQAAGVRKVEQGRPLMATLEQTKVQDLVQKPKCCGVAN